ncbi:MAG: right-handed parallel beta-helix repeat-containing protein [Planctomycetes bacterium]|nr:right-handed parallel beta-helix repeat-containing protein [Planctomycetota bacterium]
MGSGNAFPFNFSPGNGRFQSAYSAAEINLASGGLVTEIRVYGSAITTVPQYGNLRLRLAHTTLGVAALTANFDTNYSGTLATGLGPVNYTPNTLPGATTSFNWYVFTLTTPFAYNGTDGLLVDWSYDTRSGTGFTVSSATGRSRIYTGTAGGSYLTATGTASATSGNYGIAIDFLTASNSTQLANQSAATAQPFIPQSNAVVMDLKASAYTTSRDLNSVTLTRSGTLADSSITSVKLVRDANDNGVVDAGDTTLASGGLSAGSVTLTGSPLLSVNTGSPERLLVVVDVNNGAVLGQTIQFAIASAGAVNWSGGTDITTYPVNGSACTITNPAPTLVPATGSGFSAARAITVYRNVALTDAVLTANDLNDSLINATIVPVSAVPGVTQPVNVSSGTVPFNLAWTGTPTSFGNYSYTVTLNDSVNSPSFTVTFTVILQPMSGNYTINQTAAADFTSIGDAFDALETAGVAGPVTLTITDSATYVSNSSYSLGSDASGSVTPVSGVSATNKITLQAAAGQTPVVQGNSTGAVLIGQSSTTGLTGRGGIVINQSYVTVQGLEVTSGPNFGLMAQGNNISPFSLNTTNITFRGNKVHDIPDGPGIAFMGQNSGYANNFVVENNFVWNCFTNSGNPTSSSVLLNNTGGAITIRNAATGTGVVRHNTVVHTSTFTTTGGIYAYSSSTTYPLNDVNNNIVICTTAGVPAILLSSATSAPTIANCNFNYWFASTHCNQSTLSTFAAWQATGRDANGSNSDPQLFSASSPFNLHLLPSSPCLDPTGQTSTLSIDIDGDTRPQGATSDIGADEGVFTPSLLGQTNMAGLASVTTNLTSDQWVASFRAVSVQSAQQVSSVTFTQVGSTSNAGLTNLKLWVDANANNQLDGADAQIAATVSAMSGATVTFTGLPAFTQNQVANLFISAQLSGSATVGTLQFSIQASTDVSTTPGPVTGTYPLLAKLINVVNPAPTLAPGTGSGFNASRVYVGLLNSSLSAADLVANDSNDPTVNITVTPVTPAPGVTAPGNQAGASVPASLSWTGTPTSVGSFTYTVVISDGTNSPNFTVTINVTNPAPTLTPATGSGFNASRVYAATTSVALSAAALVANDANDPTVDITVTAVTPAPGVTTPSNQAGATVPATLTWTGTPTTVGSYTYTVIVNDGVSSPNFTVTINVTNPAPTLAPATGSAFNASRVYSALSGVSLSNASLVAADTNDPTISVTITPVSAAPGVSQPADQNSVSSPATITWTGTPTTVGTYTYTVVVNDGTNAPNFTVTINVTNPAPTLTPATGSGFTAARVYTAVQGVALSVASLVANDQNDATVSYTVTPISAAPGVTAPTNQTNVAVPATLSWTGTPTAPGSFSYTVQVTDGVNPPSFTVTINVAFNGTVTVANGNPGSAFGYGDLGNLFDDLEAFGMAGPVIVEVYDDGGAFTSSAKYRVGMTDTGTTLAPISGLSATNTLTIRAAAGESPVISGNGALNTYTTTAWNGTLAFRNLGNITLQGLEFTGGDYFGVMWYASTTGSSDNIVISRCKFHGITIGAAIYMYGSSNNIGPNNVLIENNTCWDVAGAGGGTLGGGTTGGPIGVIGARRPGSNFVIRHNTILHTSSTATSGGAIYVNGETTQTVLADVSYNIIYVNTPAAVSYFYMDPSTTALAPTVADRNVVFLAGSAVVSNNTSFSTWALWQGSNRDLNGVNADPQLVSISTGSEDLHIQATSPAINLASGSPTSIDIDGDSRPLAGGTDAGADEANIAEIEVLQGSTNITDGGSFNAGSVSTASGASITFTINNLGSANLLLTGGPAVVATIVSNLDAGSGVQTQPAITTISAAGTTTFVVFVDPTAAGTFSLDVSIDNNDANENPFNFTVDGMAFVPNGEAEANTTGGSSLSGGTNGPFSIALNPGAALSNVEIELTDPESDNITVTSITLLTSAPTGITAPAIPGSAGQPVSLVWTGTAAASNNPGDFTWEITFADVANQTPVIVLVTITINNLAPTHSIAGASGGTGATGNPYTTVYTQTMGVSSSINLANVSDPNTSQTLSIGSVTPGGSNPSGGNGFSFTLGGGLLSVAPASVLASGDVGTHTFDVAITDGALSTTIAVSILVNAAPSFVTTSPIMDGEQGLAYSFQIVAQGGTGALAFTFAGGTMAPGLGLNASGLVSGTATQQGVYIFSVTITDTLSVATTAPFQITIDPPANGNPTITTTSPLPAGTANRAYTAVTLTATGGTAPYSWSVVGTLPPGMLLSPAGVLSGTPTLKGTYAFSITVADAAFASDTDAFQITIKADPTAGAGGGGGGGGGGGCVSSTMNAVPWALFAMLCVLLVSVRVRSSRE